MSKPTRLPGDSSSSIALITLLLFAVALLLLPAAGQAAQTFDPPHNAFADAAVVPLDDSFLNVGAITGTTAFSFSVDGVQFTFSSTAPFEFLCVGQAGAPPCILASFTSIHVAVGAPLDALGFVLAFAEARPAQNFRGLRATRRSSSVLGRWISSVGPSGSETSLRPI